MTRSNERIYKHIAATTLNVALTLAKAAKKGVDVNPWVFALKEFIRPVPTVSEAQELKHRRKALEELARLQKAEDDLLLELDKRLP